MGERATLGMLQKKQPKTEEVQITIINDAGEEQEVSLLFKALGATEYDNLLDRYPASSKQRREGLAFNPDLFGPALLAAVCVEPKMSLEDATEIWNSDHWSRGERLRIFNAAVDLCNYGMNIPFTGTD